jgi:N-hydroxyarylamine O-acetyltransferase
MTESIDLDAYLARIGYDGPRTPTLETLTALHALHPSAIAFENLDVLLGRQIRLDLPALEAKLVHGGRGGYCFEHNSLMAAALRALGFKVTGLAARVQWGRSLDDPRLPRTHMALRVDLPRGPYLVDVGFGGLTKTAPLAMRADVEQDTGTGVFRLVSADAGFRLEAKLPAGWSPMFEFDLTPAEPADYVMANWFTSTHPTSRHINSLIAARVVDGRRWALLNDTVSVYSPEAPPERRRVTAAELPDLLSGPFAIRLPDDAPALAGVYERFAPAS